MRRFSNQIVANQVLFLDRPPIEQRGEEESREPVAGGNVEAEDLPF